MSVLLQTSFVAMAVSFPVTFQKMPGLGQLIQLKKDAKTKDI